MQYMKAAHRGPTCEKIVICNMCNDDWNIDHIRWSKKCPPLEDKHYKKNLHFICKYFVCSKIYFRNSNVKVILHKFDHVSYGIMERHIDRVPFFKALAKQSLLILILHILQLISVLVTRPPIRSEHLIIPKNWQIEQNCCLYLLTHQNMPLLIY